jgi:hypothetical protein
MSKAAASILEMLSAAKVVKTERLSVYSRTPNRDLLWLGDFGHQPGRVRLLAAGSPRQWRRLQPAVSPVNLR